MSKSSHFLLGGRKSVVVDGIILLSLCYMWGILTTFIVMFSSVSEGLQVTRRPGAGGFFSVAVGVPTHPTDANLAIPTLITPCHLAFHKVLGNLL